MKKKLIALLLCCTLAAVTGCTGNEAEYNVLDYVKLGEYKNLAVTLTQDYEVDESDLEDYVNNTIIENNPYLLEADHDTVQEGDYANIDYVGTKDGEAFIGGSAEGFDLGIGTGTFIPGFEDGIIGMQVGDERDLNLTFPENYGNGSSDLAGADVVFHVTLNKIQRKEDVSYDTFSDEYTTFYAQKNDMSYTSAEVLLADVMSYLQGTAMNQRAAAIRTQVLPMLLENCTIEKYPKGLLEAEVEQTKKLYTTGYGALYGDLENIGQSVFNLTLEEFEEKIQEETEENLKIEMILDAIAQEEKIEIDEEQYAAYIQRLVSNNEFESEEALYLSYGEDEEDGRAQIRQEYIRIQALSLVINAADVTVEESTGTK